MTTYITKNNFNLISNYSNIKLSESFNDFLDLSKYTNIIELEYGWTYNKTINNILPISLKKLKLNKT